MNKKLIQRFDELELESKQIENTVRIVDGLYGPTKTIDKELFISWTVKVKNLISISCGETSQHFKAFVDGEKPRSLESSNDIFKRLKAIFSAAKEDFNGGYLTSVKNLIQAEVFENELEQAESLLSNGYKLAAAVIAGVVLETALRDLCTREGIGHGKLDKMNSDLAKAGIYNKLQQKRITALADIRNSAAHGKPDEFTDADVNNMIRDVEQFLAIQLV